MLTSVLSSISGLNTKWNNFIDVIILKIKLRKSNEAKGSLDYIIKQVTKNQTIICIGIYTVDELLILRKAIGTAGRLLVFVPDVAIKNELSKIPKLLNWLNVSIELIEYSDAIENYVVINNDGIKDLKKEAAIININDRKLRKGRDVSNLKTIENYITARNLFVDFIQIKISENNFYLLQATEDIIKRFEPEVIAEYEATKTEKTFFYKAIGFFIGLHYKGFFVLDTLNIPLANFDFDIYQNPRSDFYCNTFVFKS